MKIPVQNSTKGPFQKCVKERRRGHFGDKMAHRYTMIEHAWHLIVNGVYEPRSDLQHVVDYYLEEGYKIDQHYRYFYYHNDAAIYQDADQSLYKYFEMLRDIVERIYTNSFLNPLIANWNHAFVKNRGKLNLLNQRRFYDLQVKRKREDRCHYLSLRYEVAKLCLKARIGSKCESNLTAMQALLPSLQYLHGRASSSFEPFA